MSFKRKLCKEQMFHLFHISNSNNICQSKINFLSRIWYIFIYFFWPWYLTAAIWKWKSSTRKIVSGTQVWTIHIPFWSSSVQTCGLMFKSNRSFSGNLDLISGSCRVLKTTWLICVAVSLSVDWHWHLYIALNSIVLFLLKRASGNLVLTEFYILTWPSVFVCSGGDSEHLEWRTHPHMCGSQQLYSVWAFWLAQVAFVLLNCGSTE